MNRTHLEEWWETSHMRKNTQHLLSGCGLLLSVLFSQFHWLSWEVHSGFKPQGRIHCPGDDFFLPLIQTPKWSKLQQNHLFFSQLELGSSLRQHIAARFHSLHSSQFPHLFSPQAHPLRFSSGNRGPLRDCNQTGKDETHGSKANALIAKLDKATP